MLRRALPVSQDLAALGVGLGCVCGIQNSRATPALAPGPVSTTTCRRFCPIAWALGRGGIGRSLGLPSIRFIGSVPFWVFSGFSFALFSIWVELLLPWTGERHARRELGLSGREEKHSKIIGQEERSSPSRCNSVLNQCLFCVAASVSFVTFSPPLSLLPDPFCGYFPG